MKLLLSHGTLEHEVCWAESSTTHELLEIAYQRWQLSSNLLQAFVVSGASVLPVVIGNDNSLEWWWRAVEKGFVPSPPTLMVKSRRLPASGSLSECEAWFRPLLSIASQIPFFACIVNLDFGEATIAVAKPLDVVVGLQDAAVKCWGYFLTEPTFQLLTPEGCEVITSALELQPPLILSTVSGKASTYPVGELAIAQCAMSSPPTPMCSWLKNDATPVFNYNADISCLQQGLHHLQYLKCRLRGK